MAGVTAEVAKGDRIRGGEQRSRGDCIRRHRLSAKSRPHGKRCHRWGLTVTATEAAADFLFDEDRLRPFLKSITANDGTIPRFSLYCDRAA